LFRCADGQIRVVRQFGEATLDFLLYFSDHHRLKGEGRRQRFLQMCCDVVSQFHQEHARLLVHSTSPQHRLYPDEKFRRMCEQGPASFGVRFPLLFTPQEHRERWEELVIPEGANVLETEGRGHGRAS
jgi:hypothetical protein